MIQIVTKSYEQPQQTEGEQRIMSEKVTKELNQLLADYMVYYQRLRNYHWNVKGTKFFDLHNKFEELYTEAATSVDDIAERILALNTRPVATLKDMVGMTQLKEDDSITKPNEMVKGTIEAIGQVNNQIRKVQDLAGEENDRTTESILDDIADANEKNAWMLRAYLEE